MINTEFRVPIEFEYVATFAWASSGALVGIRKHFDVVGVFAIALLASTGGGLLRDGLFLSRTPAVVTDFMYLPLILSATLVMCILAYCFGRSQQPEGFQKLVDLIDAIGTPAFAVYGMQLAQDHHISLPGVLLVGVLNGVGGGLLRDVVVREIPTVFRPGQFLALTLTFVCGLFLFLTEWARVPPGQAAWWTVGLFFVVRLLTVKFNWHTRSVLPEIPLKTESPDPNNTSAKP